MKIESAITSQINTQVAKDVMGWVEVVSDGLYYWRDVDLCERTGSCSNNIARKKNTRGHDVEDIEIWTPSTDMAAAWQVVEKIKDTPRQLAYFVQQLDIQCSVDKYPMNLATLVMIKNMNPLTICRAALKAMEQLNEMD